MIALLAPLGLAALAALLVPLIVHLVRRSDEQVVPFAAMRYLRARPHPRERLRLSEPLLLALRLLLIASLAVLLAIPGWRHKDAAAAPWIVVAPGVSAEAAQAAAPATLAEWHRLAPGFPALSADASSGAPAFSSLVRELDAQLPAGTPLTLVVPEELGGLDAERLLLSHTVAWRVVPGASPASAVSADDAAASSVRLAVRYDDAGSAELKVARALAAAWAARGIAVSLDIAPRDAPLPAPPAWLLWLAGPLPPAVEAWVRRGGRALASRQVLSDGEAALIDESGAVVLRARELGLGRLLTLAAPLEPAKLGALLQPEFPQTLFTLLRAPARAPDRAAARDVAPRNLPQAPADPVRRLDAGLALWIALLYLVERVTATRRRR
jgi:hypothetical protein